MAIEIEDGVPLPTFVRGGGRPHGAAKYPLRELRAGQSFFIAGGNALLQRLSSCISSVRKRGCKSTFATRKVEKDGVPGVRVWCLTDGSEPVPLRAVK